MIKAKGITLRRGSKVLLNDASFVINPKERLGIVGANGTGKTSLFALLLSELSQDEGELEIPPSWVFSTVKQTISTLDHNRIAREFVIDGDEKLRTIQKQRKNADENDGHLIAQLENSLIEANAWSASSRAEQLLAGLGFSPKQWDLPVNSFSGGWQMRLSLAKALMKPSDILLLDEPTNHLDLDAMLWLESWLKNYDGTVLVISHDTEFLNNISQNILNLDQQKLFRYRGNYEQFVIQKNEHIKQNQLAYEKQQQEITHMHSFIDRFRAKASKAKQAQSRLKALSKMEQLTLYQDQSKLQFHLPQPEQMPDPLITLNGVNTGYVLNDQSTITVLKSLNLMIRGGDRIGILGVNGAGKSTLIKTLAQELKPLAGEVSFSKGVKIAYFAQHQLDMLDVTASPLLHLQRLAPKSTDQELRNYLASFGFKNDQTLSPVEPFSGGEKARLALALLVWQKPNLLLLDEPSNHLDVDTRQALTQALANFEGSMLLVSHDRHLLKTTVDSFWIVAEGQVELFDGDLEDYHQWLIERQRQQGKKSVTSSKSSTPTIDRKTQRRLEAEERQRIAQLKKPLLKKINAVEKRLNIVTEKIKNIDNLILQEDFYTEDNKSFRVEALNTHGQLSTEQEELELEWLQIQEKMESIENNEE